MTAANSPIKVDVTTDHLISHAAHFLGRSKKDIVDTAVREYIDAHREELNAGVRAALVQLDGSPASTLSLITGLTKEEIDDLGGLPPETP